MGVKLGGIWVNVAVGEAVGTGVEVEEGMGVRVTGGAVVCGELQPEKRKILSRASVTGRIYGKGGIFPPRGWWVISRWFLG